MGKSGDQLFFAMEYVPGKDAAALLKAHGPLSINRAVALVGQLLSALQYAHDRRFVHRDIKPSNLLVTEVGGDEVAKLADFGLARTYQTSRLSGLTMSGSTGGTVAYMAPERVTDFRDVKPAADQYAAAATLYNLLTSRLLYDPPAGGPGPLLAMLLTDDPVPIQARRADIPQPLAAVIHRALARQPDDRFPDAQAMGRALKDALRTRGSRPMAARVKG